MRWIGLILLLPSLLFSQNYSRETIRKYDSIGAPWEEYQAFQEQPFFELNNTHLRVLKTFAFGKSMLYRIHEENDSTLITIKRASNRVWGSEQLGSTNRFTMVLNKEFKYEEYSFQVPDSIGKDLLILFDSQFFDLERSSDKVGSDGWNAHVEGRRGKEIHYVHRWSPSYLDDGTFFKKLDDLFHKILLNHKVQLNILVTDSLGQPIPKAKVEFSGLGDNFKTDNMGRIHEEWPLIFLLTSDEIKVRKSGFKQNIQPLVLGNYSNVKIQMSEK